MTAEYCDNRPDSPGNGFSEGLLAIALKLGVVNTEDGIVGIGTDKEALTWGEYELCCSHSASQR